MSLSEKLPEFIRRRLQTRDTIRRAIDNSLWLACDQLLRLIAGLVVGVWLARYLGPERYGWLNYALAAVGVISSLASFGINAVVVREVARNPSESNEWIGTAFFLRCIGASVGYLGCVGVLWLQSSTVTEVDVLILIVGVGMLFQTFDVVDMLFQARGEARISAWVRMGACLCGSLLRVTLILSHAELWAFAVAGVAEIGLNACGWWWSAARCGWPLKHWRCERPRVFALIRESWPLAVAGLAIYAQAYADQLVIGTALGGNELGQYAAAVRLVSLFAFVPTVIQVVALPEITRAKRDDETLYHRRLHGLYRLMFGLFLMTAIPVAILGPVAARLLYGVSYTEAAALLPWLAIRLFFTNFGVARSIFVTNEGLFRFALITAVAGAIINVLLNIILVPRWGAHGAIASSIASFTVTTFALEVFEPRARANLRLVAQAVFLPWRRFQG